MKKVKILLFMAVVAAAGLLSIKTQAKGDVSVPEVTKGIYVYDDADMISNELTKEYDPIISANSKAENDSSSEEGSILGGGYSDGGSASR